MQSMDRWYIDYAEGLTEEALGETVRFDSSAVARGQ